MEVNYVVITPVRNEEKFIEKTLKSMVSQTIPPLQWIIVDDNSTDNTSNIVKDYARSYPWIKKIEARNSGLRKTGGRVIRLFNEGVSMLDVYNWDYIVKLDADLSFERWYFKELIHRFFQDHRLGIASGVYFEMDSAGKWRLVNMPFYHAAGACKMVSRKCYQEIGGFIERKGWDTVDEIRAIAQGWKTRHFSDLKMKHHKPEGSGIGILRTNFMHGEIYYSTGGDKLFFVAKVLHRVISKPYFLSAFALLLGYLKAALAREPLLVNDIEAQCYKRLLRARLRSTVRGLLN